MNQLILSVSKTLYDNTYRCTISTSAQEVIGFLRVIPGLPLERSLVPEDAPLAPPFLLVIVDDADITEETLLDFEDNISASLLERFATPEWRPRYCQFYYPSPAFIFNDTTARKPPVM